jgi:hypothetical protein
MKYKCFCSKDFYDLSADEIKAMRRNTGGRRIDIQSFLEYYEINAQQYFDRIRTLKGISITSDERRVVMAYKEKQTEHLPKEDYLFSVDNLPDIFVAAMYQIDFEVIKGARYYDVEELEKAREDIRDKVNLYEEIIKETTNNMAYSTLRGIDLVAMRIYRGYNRMKFSKLSRLPVSEMKLYESSKIKIPKYIEDIYTENLAIKRRHIAQLRDIMNGKSDKVVEDRTIPKLIKLKVYKRDKGRCTECGKNNKKLHYHHIKRFSDGGQHTLENLKLLCISCHAEEHKGEKGYHLLRGGI